MTRRVRINPIQEYDPTNLIRTLCPNGAYSDTAVFVSSGGPGIAALTTNRETAVAAMRNVGITDTHVLDIDNAGVRFSAS
jgi:hypothetical protein